MKKKFYKRFLNKWFGRKNETTVCRAAENENQAEAQEVIQEVPRAEAMPAEPVRITKYNGLEIEDDIILKKYTGEEKMVIVPEGIRKIEEGAFYGNEYLEEIILPESVREIGKRAFQRCSFLQKIVLPEKVEQIGESAFEDCDSLCNVTLPDHIKEIDWWTFRNCKKLSRISLPAELRSIAYGAFEHSGIREIDIPQKVSGIGKKAFEHCESLTEVRLPEGLIKIGEDAFKGCGLLSKVIFPKSLFLAENAFERTPVENSAELQDAANRIKEFKIKGKPAGYQKMIVDGLSFYYFSEEVDYKALDKIDNGEFRKYNLEYQYGVADAWWVSGNKSGQQALVIYVSVPTFDSGDCEWDSYRKLYLIPENGRVTGFWVCGGSKIAKILRYEDIRWGDEKTEIFMEKTGIFLSMNGIDISS